VIGYRGTLDVPRELAPVRCEAAVGKLRRRGTPRGSRALSCFWQAVVGLRWFRDRTAPDALARDHGISRPPRASASSSSMLDAPTGSTSLVSSAADAVASASDLIDAYRLIVSRRSWAAASGCSPADHDAPGRHANYQPWRGHAHLPNRWTAHLRLGRARRCDQLMRQQPTACGCQAARLLEHLQRLGVQRGRELLVQDGKVITIQADLESRAILVGVLRLA